MRISDWSSDVCSSDLSFCSDIIASFREGPAKTVRKHYRALAGSYLIAHATRSHKTQHEQNDEDRKSNEEQYLRDSNEGSAYSAKTKASQNHAYHKERSEEHTSELQSLMRISYA